MSDFDIKKMKRESKEKLESCPKCGDEEFRCNCYDCLVCLDKEFIVVDGRMISCPNCVDEEEVEEDE